MALKLGRAASLALLVQAAPPGNPNDWSLVFGDDFDTFNDSKWTKGWSWYDGRGRSRPRRHTKDGDECLFADENVFIEDGKLILENRRESRGGFNYTSGTVNTLQYNGSQGFEQVYGYFEARIKASPGGEPGQTPAFWMPNRANSGDDGHSEIDVVEIPGADCCGSGRAAWFTVHDGFGAKRYGNYFYPVLDEPFVPRYWGDDFHDYGLLWMPGMLAFYIDGVERFRTCELVPATPAYMVLDNEIGLGHDTWSGEPDAAFYPQRMSIDHVRVWRNLNGESQAVWI